MKRIILAPRLQTVVTFEGKDPVLPPDFCTTVGLLIWRDTRRTISWWNGREWFLLNAAGWACTFQSPFPDHVKVGHWAILAPVKFRRSRDWFQQFLDAKSVEWAMACPTPGGKVLLPEPELA